MIEISASSAHFDALKDFVGGLNDALEAELPRANHRIGQKCNADARKLLSEEVYGVPIPIKASANRTFDMETVPKQLRPYVKAPTFKRKLTENFLDKNFASSRQTKDGQVFRKWRRTGALLQHERYVLSIEGRGAFSVALVNTMDYALARDALGQPNPPNKSGRKAGIQRPQSKVPEREKSKTRPVRWQQVAVTQNKDFIAVQYREAIARAIGRTP